jgi:hypothetical protein
MKSTGLAGCAALALMLAAGGAVARDLPSGGVTRQEVAGWLQQQGYKANIHNDSSGESIVSSTSSAGVNFDIYFFSCTSGRCSSLQYAAGWDPLTLGTADHINAWNRDKRYLRAYLDAHNNVWAEYDVDIDPGGSWEQMDQSLARFNAQVGDFKTYFNGG